MLVLYVSLFVFGPSSTSADKPESANEVVHPRVWAQLEHDSQTVAVWVFLSDKGITPDKNVYAY